MAVLKLNLAIFFIFFSLSPIPLTEQTNSVLVADSVHSDFQILSVAHSFVSIDFGEKKKKKAKHFPKSAS